MPLAERRRARKQRLCGARYGARCVARTPCRLCGARYGARCVARTPCRAGRRVGRRTGRATAQHRRPGRATGRRCRTGRSTGRRRPHACSELRPAHSAADGCAAAEEAATAAAAMAAAAAAAAAASTTVPMRQQLLPPRWWRRVAGRRGTSAKRRLADSRRLWKRMVRRAHPSYPSYNVRRPEAVGARAVRAEPARARGVLRACHTRREGRRGSAASAQRGVAKGTPTRGGATTAAVGRTTAAMRTANLPRALPPISPNLHRALPPISPNLHRALPPQRQLARRSTCTRAEGNQRSLGWLTRGTKGRRRRQPPSDARDGRRAPPRGPPRPGRAPSRAPSRFAACWASSGRSVRRPVRRLHASDSPSPRIAPPSAATCPAW